MVVLDRWEYLGEDEAEVAEAAKDEALVGAELFEQRSGHDTRDSDREVQDGEDVETKVVHAVFLQD